MARWQTVQPTHSHKSTWTSKLYLAAALMLCVSCAQTSVRPLALTGDKQLPVPTRILIHDFAVSETEVTEYQGIMRQQPANRNPLERQRDLGKHAAETLVMNLIDGLRKLGFVVQRAQRDAPVNDGDLIIAGRFVHIDQGNPLHRLLIGFGSGAAKMETRMQVLHGTQQTKLLEFATKSDSGKLPGAVATAPVTAAVPATVGVALAAGSMATTGLIGNSPDISHMAAASADQAVRYLSEFFFRQGWISANRSAKPRIGS